MYMHVNTHSKTYMHTCTHTHAQMSHICKHTQTRTRTYTDTNACTRMNKHLRITGASEHLKYNLIVHNFQRNSLKEKEYTCMDKTLLPPPKPCHQWQVFWRLKPHFHSKILLGPRLEECVCVWLMCVCTRTQYLFFRSRTNTWNSLCQFLSGEHGNNFYHNSGGAMALCF